MSIIDKINETLQGVQDMHAANLEELEALRIKYLSKKGVINALMGDFREVAADQKREVGMKLNELKTQVQDKINALKEQFDGMDNVDEEIDLTRTAYPSVLGTRHPLTIVKNEIIDIFGHMGFKLAEGPEVEDDLHVYTKLNFAADHPARDMQDTFFVEQNQNVIKNIILRSHTSSVQARVMEQKQVLLTFAREMFGNDTKIRLRPSYFPFTEPSAEMDISCNICGGKGCGFCKHTGWVEILGCGMVDPNVLEACGIDSKVYTGYAFGMGIERIANLKYQVSDLRLFSENDVRFLREFEAAY